MAHETHLGDTRYISSAHAAELSGYSRDYIGQLARAGKIIARQVGGFWYILEESLRSHKYAADAFVPTPPEDNGSRPADSLVTFDGKRYVSAAEASRITLYHQDYITQLARSGTILSQQVANRWFVDAEALKAHKQEKDRMLGAVQAESVGIDRTRSEVRPEFDMESGKPHFSYTSEDGDLIPVLMRHVQEQEASEILDEPAQTIPIRVVRTQRRERSRTSAQEASYGGRNVAYGGFTALVFTIVIVLAFNIQLFDGRITFTDARKQSSVVNAAVASAAEEAFVNLKTSINGIFVRKVEYQRK